MEESDLSEYKFMELEERLEILEILIASFAFSVMNSGLCDKLKDKINRYEEEKDEEILKKILDYDEEL